MSKRREDQPRLPKQNEMLEGARLALTNSRRHLRAARILGKERLFGPGVAHIVLSLEEHAKAWTLTFGMVGIDVPKRTLREILTRHDARQGVSFGIVAIAAIRLMAVQELAKQFPAAQRPKNDPGLSLLEWVLNANELKNRGLYVDFDGEKWIAPTAVSARQFAVGYEIANRLLREFGATYRNIKKMKPKATQKLKDIVQQELAVGSLPPKEFMNHLISAALEPSVVDIEEAFTLDTE